MVINPSSSDSRTKTSVSVKSDNGIATGKVSNRAGRTKTKNGQSETTGRTESVSNRSSGGDDTSDSGGGDNSGSGNNGGGNTHKQFLTC